MGGMVRWWCRLHLACACEMRRRYGMRRVLVSFGAREHLLGLFFFPLNIYHCRIFSGGVVVLVLAVAVAVVI
jgi:hypothetical protein